MFSVCARLQESGCGLNSEKIQQTVKRRDNKRRQVRDLVLDKFVNSGFGTRRTIEGFRVLAIAERDFFTRSQTATGWSSGTKFGVRLSLER